MWWAVWWAAWWAAWWVDVKRKSPFESAVVAVSAAMSWLDFVSNGNTGKRGLLPLM